MTEVFGSEPEERKQHEATKDILVESASTSDSKEISTRQTESSQWTIDPSQLRSSNSNRASQNSSLQSRHTMAEKKIKDIENQIAEERLSKEYEKKQH